MFIGLKPFDERKRKDVSMGALVGTLNQKLSVIQGAFVAVFPPPAVNGLGAVGGFKLQLEDRAGLGDSAVYAAAQTIKQQIYFSNRTYTFTTMNRQVLSGIKLR